MSAPGEIAAIAWLGPIVHEYYSGSGGRGSPIDVRGSGSAHPGSVGRSMVRPVARHRLGGDPAPAGVEGDVWFGAGDAIEYHGDADGKTAAAVDPARVDDLDESADVDDDGYLYLTDRRRT